MWLMLRRAAAEEEEDENSFPSTSSSSSLASGFVRDREAESEALSYIDFSSPLPSEEEEKQHHRHHRQHHHDKRAAAKTATSPLARRAELYRRAWLAAVDEVLEKLVKETPGGSRYPTSDMGVRSRVFYFFFFSFLERDRRKKRR